MYLSKHVHVIFRLLNYYNVIGAKPSMSHVFFETEIKERVIFRNLLFISRLFSKLETRWNPANLILKRTSLRSLLRNKYHFIKIIIQYKSLHITHFISKYHNLNYLNFIYIIIYNL